MSYFRISCVTHKHELLEALRKRTIGVEAHKFYVTEWSRDDAAILRKIAEMLDREMDARKDVFGERIP